MSDIRAAIGQPFDTVFRAGETGLLGVQYLINDNEGNIVLGPTGAGIAELGSTGVYAATPTAPGTEGEWSVIWSRDGTFAPDTLGVDSLVTYDPGTSAPTVGDLVPIAADSTVGPCQAWTTAEQVAACCQTESDVDVLEDAVVAASQTLYALVPRFPGECGPRRVRPCVSSRCGALWDAPVFWTGTTWTQDPMWGPSDPPSRLAGCGCAPLSVVPLAGYVREVLEVTIDGEIVPDDQYRVDRNRRLVRLFDDDGDPAFWPACQDDRAEYLEDGTFSVLYTYGADPPALGILAATELACAIAQTCAGSGGSATAPECPLPNNVVRVVRQGITIEMKAFTGWSFVADRGWATGLPLTDMFLNTYNPRGRRRRRATAWSPDLQRYPRPEGVEATS